MHSGRATKVGAMAKMNELPQVVDSQATCRPQQSGRAPRLLVPFALFAVIIAGAGCSERPDEAADAWEPPVASIRVAPRLQPLAIGEDLILYEPGYDYKALVRTDKGEFTIELFDQETPETVANFIMLASYDQYDDNIFFEVLADTYVVTGDASGFGTPDIGITIRGEFTEREFVAGTVGMSRSADDPDSASGLWFVTLEPRPEFKGRYAAFGQVVEGLDVVRQISRVPTHDRGDVSARIQRRPVNPPKVLDVEITRTQRPLTQQEIERFNLQPDGRPAADDPAAPGPVQEQ